MSLTPETVKRGMRCNWKHQPDRLIYLGKKGSWHQFARIGSQNSTSDFVWCEVLDADLHMLEETQPDEGAKP